MRGIKDFNFPEFHRNAALLRAEGHEVFNPAERDEKEFGAEILKTATGSEEEVALRMGLVDKLGLARKCFLADTMWICIHAEGIAIMPGWENSRGARAEKALAEAIGLEVRYL
jgi:hypothetical protein